jgi:hypothetical protein
MQLARSSFPELGNSTKPSYTVCTTTSYNHFHLSLQVLTNSMHKASGFALSHKYSLVIHLAHWPLLTSPNYLFIHYKMGLNMGKPMGRHPITCYINPKPKNPAKNGRDTAICAYPCAPPWTSLSKSQNQSNVTQVLQNLSKGQQAPNTHL